MISHVANGHLNVCAMAAICMAALAGSPAAALQSGTTDILRDTGDVLDLPAIDGSGEAVYLDFNAPLPSVIAALLRTSSYEWPLMAFESLVKKHGRSKVRAAIADHLRAMSDAALLESHKGAAHDSQSPLSELRLPGDTWMRK